ncbi:MAG: exosome complex RNA-binding protein Csl4 [Candidatus Bathyarchaeota archaeon]|jgi:exosome complex component CSL4|nr:exosome complex RNA-binding protein Csl4 [Candidatus Bathyarchaeota archaeon]
MPKKTMKDRDVYPGEKLAVIEVLHDGTGTYQQEGEVRSAELGKAHFNLEKRLVEVEKKTKELVLPVEGLEIIAEAGSVMRRDARVDVFVIDGKRVYKPYTGVIHVSDASKDYMKDMGMAMRNGDIVKAKIINTKNRIIQLSIASPEYGVVYAYCSRCGALLEQRGNRLHCPKCDRVERRKTAKTYGKEELA